MKLIKTLGLAVALFALLALPARAQPTASAATRLANLEAAVAALTTQVQNQATTIATLQAALAGEIADRKTGDNSAKLYSDTVLVSAKSYADGVGLSTLAGAKTYADSVGASSLASAKTYADGVATTSLNNAKTYSDGRLSPVADKVFHFARSGNNVFITGANLHVRNGQGSTIGASNGLGNLIVGYNETRNQGTANPDVRTGSHNLVLGTGANFSHTGSFITGINNSSTNHFASVYGGTGNSAGGTFSVVVGGFNNQANGGWATILGGRDRTAASQLDHLP